MEKARLLRNRLIRRRLHLLQLHKNHLRLNASYPERIWQTIIKRKEEENKKRSQE